MEPKVVVTMTSWKGRISHLAKQIFIFFKTQTVKPDIFYLWLAEEEFPKKEESLPENLLLICEGLGVKIRWTEKNEFCFKRWHVYPEHYNDLVISIDDDILFDANLIKEARKHINERNISYNIFKDLTFRHGFNRNNTRIYDYRESRSIYYRFLGCSVICPNTFPLRCLDKNLLLLREKINRRQDEQWIKAFMVMNATKISFLNFSYKSCAIAKLANENSTWSHFYKKYNGFRVEDYQMYMTLASLPMLMDAWKKTFPEFDSKIFENEGLGKIKALLKSNGC